MIVFNAGVPRSGTVLVNAILRQIFEANGIRIAQANPHGEALPKLIRTLQRTAQDRYKTVLVHTHSWDAATAGMTRSSLFVTGFINYRDPRDVCVSLMRLHEHDFETAVRMTLASFRIFDAMAHEADLMILPYERLVADKAGHIFQIARKLGFWLGLDQVDRIDEATSVDRHKAVMEKVQSGELDGLSRRQNTNRVLVEDPKTLINDRHIQSGASGRWKEELSERDQNAANDRFGELLKRYGYPA
jgi:hypothetical protein